MALELATAYVSLSVSSKGIRGEVDRELNKSVAGADKAGKKAGGKFKSGMSGALKGFGAGLVAGLATDKVVGFFRDAQKGASDLEQSVGGVQAVFKDFAPQIEKSSKGAAQSLGLTRNEYNELATTLGAGLKNKGFKDFGEQTQNLIGIGSDLSAQFGGSTQEAVDALASAMRGEMDPIEKYGISLNEAALKAEAVALGLSDGKGALTESAKAQASLSLITKQSADAQGAFARESDTAAGKQARFRASMENLKTTIGEKLLPVVSDITGAANGFLVEMEKGEGAGGKFKDIVIGIKDALVSAVEFVVKYKDQLIGLGIAVGTLVVAQKAYKVATMLATLWTKKQAIMQALLNRALMMNPIGLIVAALVALGVGLVVAYKKSETFRRIVDAAWAGIKKAAAATVKWFKDVAWPAMKTVFKAIGDTARMLWRDYISPAFRAIGNVVKWLWQKVVRPYIGFVLGYWKTVFGWLKNTGWPWVKAALGAIGNAAKSLWNNWIKPYFGRVKDNAKAVFGWIKNTGWPWIKTAFQAIGDKAKWLWEKGVKTPLSKMKAGFKALKDTALGVKDALVKRFGQIRDGIRKPLRQIMTFIDKKFISKVKGMLHGVGLGTLSAKIPYLTPGGKGFATGGYTGPGSKYAPAGVVHADEFVLRKEATNKLRKSIGLGGLDYMNRTGQMPGYASGGLVYKDMVEWLNRSVPGAVVTSTNGGKHSANSNHYRNRAIDIGGSPEVMRSAASSIMRNFGSKILELIHNPGFSVKNGQKVSPGFWGGSTWGNHSNHVHWAMQSMSGKGGNPLTGLLSGFAGKVLDGGKKTLTDILDNLPGSDGFWGKTAVAPMRMVAGGVFDKFKAAASMMGGGGDSSSVAPGKGVERWRPTVLRALGILGMSDKYANSTLRRMMQESGGNPRALNNWDSNARRGTPSKGLMQVIDPTFRAYAMQGFNRDIYDPLSNILASMRYAVATYGNLFNAYDRKGGYASGGLVKPAVFDNGGTLAPGLNLVHNKLGKPEPLVRPEQAMPSRLRIESGALSFDERGRAYLEGVATAVYEDQERHAAMRGRLGVGRGF